MKKKLLTTLAIILTGSLSFAQSLVPATSEDLSEFDQQIANSSNTNLENAANKKPVTAGKSKDSNFGAVVSEKAKDLKNEDLEQKKNFGSETSQAHKNDDDKGNSSASGKANGNVPRPTSSGNSSIRPGNGKTR